MRFIYAYYVQIDLAVDKQMCNMAMQRQLVTVAHLHDLLMNSVDVFHY